MKNTIISISVANVIVDSEIGRFKVFNDMPMHIWDDFVKDYVMFDFANYDSQLLDSIRLSAVEAIRKAKNLDISRPEFRSDKEIVEQTERLAKMLMLRFYNRVPMKDGIKLRVADDLRSKLCWNVACDIQEMITETDPENAVSEIEN